MSEIEIVESLFDFIEDLIFSGLELNEAEQKYFDYLRKEWTAYMNDDYEDEGDDDE
jgi:hypothetical protein